MQHLVSRIILLSLLIFFADVGLSQGQFPQDFTEPLNQIMKLSTQKNYSEALKQAVKLWNDSVHRSSIDRVIAGNLVVAQYVNLGQWSEGETLILAMLQIPDVEYQAGLYSFSQKAALNYLMEKWISAKDYEHAVAFAHRVLEIREEWVATEDYRLATFWIALGDGQLAQGKLNQAISSWERGRACWESKKLMWKQWEPTQYEKYQGMDRVNPLQISVEAYLLAAYTKTGNNLKSNEILTVWKKHLEVFRSAHKDDDQLGLELFKKSIRKNVKKAEAALELNGLSEQVLTFTGNNNCKSLLNLDDSPNK